jgi:hypothetical protein
MAWPNVKIIIGLCAGNVHISEHQLDLWLGTFSRLKPATARRVLEFQRQRSITARALCALNCIAIRA